MFIPVFVFLSPKKPSHRSFIKSNDFPFFPQARTVQLRKIEFRQHRQFSLHTLTPKNVSPSLGRASYTHQVLTFHNVFFAANNEQPFFIPTNPKHSQFFFQPTKIPKICAQSDFAYRFSTNQMMYVISHWRRLIVRAGANRFLYKLGPIDSQVS